MVLLKELAHCLRRTTDSIRLRHNQYLAFRMKDMTWCSHLPFTVDASRFSLVQLRLRVMRIKSYNEGGDSEWTDTTRLRVFLHCMVRYRVRI